MLPTMGGSVEFDTNRWIWNGACYPQLVGLGGIMITIAILWLSTGYFGGIGVPYFPYFWLDLGIFCKKKDRKRPVRVYMDGCFDLMHYGHANALRQAKALGDELVVGVVSDEEIVANKGPPVLSMEERLILVSGLKWVDEVIANAPYAITEEFMNTLFNKYNIDYIIHGDDPCLLPDGTDAYGPAKKAGRYKQIKRTEGVSSTDIVGRILSSLRGREVDKNHNKASQSEPRGSIRTQLSHFLPTSRRIMQFSNGKGPEPDARVVYIDGAFDLFHAGHVEITTFNISLVVHGTVAEGSCNNEVDPYATPKSMGIFKTIASPKNITSTSVARRIIDNHEAYKKRNAKKSKSENRYYAEKKFVSED
uniref:ethanolamine-phosphate cytidylyltransferase n=1 Tax=Elaeis guineensis var. tenera TaxID=51953 RepID=A0A8N4F1N3_ELAGV|nr:ethanolamine-phosphate cytidylyltransferase isoform X2 [Elaeis guineensis]